MPQARVTDYFAQTKKCAGTTKATKPWSRASTRSKAAAHKEELLCSSVHEEFVRVIDEAAGLKDGHTGEHISSPPNHKRTFGDAEFDLGAAVFSTNTGHSTAKKSRPAVAKAPEKNARRTAKKKLVPQEHPQQQAARPAELNGETQTPPKDFGKDSVKFSKRHSIKVLSREELAALKSHLQGIKKQAEAISSTAFPALESTAALTCTDHPTSKTVPQPMSKGKELKTTVARAKELAAKAQKRKEERKLSESSERKSIVQSAYQKYHTLAQAVPPGLSLPYQYKVLAEMFRCMDTVVAMLYNRSEVPTFMKIKKGVQDMMHKHFEESHIGQIKTVFPEAYTLRQEKNIPTFNSSIKNGSYQLTVEPIIHCDERKAWPVLTASCLLERRHIFHYNLVSIVKQHHKAFLSALDPPLSVPDDKLSRWHPRFNVDTVPAIAVCSLPQLPHTERLTTAQEVLDKARSLITPKMKRALASVALKSEDKTAKSKEVPSLESESPASQTPTALKGVSQSLLERIRAKEAQKLQAAMTRNPAQDERLLLMSRLSELARILRNVFVAEKKPALIMEVACNRMVASYTSALSTGDMEKHIRLLAEVASDWLTIVPIRKDFYLKLNKNMELSAVQDKLSSRLKEEERL